MSLHSLFNRVPASQKQRIRQVLAVLPPGLRQTADYRHWRRFLGEAQHWPAEEIRAWQLERLREIIRHAVAHTEGYRELYSKAGIKPDDVRSPEDVRLLPFTSKEMFRDNLTAFTVQSGSKRYITTGGSTGIPFGFYESRSTDQIERAFMQTGWSWTGWKLGQPSAVLRGGHVGSEGDFAVYDPFHRELALSSYFLTAKTAAAYVEAVRTRNIRVMQAYPSSLNLLCDLLKEQELADKLELDVIFLGSENVYAWQLEKFEQTFPQTKLFSWYGHCEKAVLAPWCESSRSFHAWPFYGLTEILGHRDEAVSEGEEGEIVGTSFHQRVTPFIRYRTMDRAVKGPPACASCGRHFPLLTMIAGRAQEVIVTRSGRFISMTAINMHDDIFDGLRQFQFRQEKPGEIVFNYVPKNSVLPPSDERKIRQGLQIKLGNDMVLSLCAVPDIPRTRSGKFRFLDQRLPIQYGDKP